jgi:tetratricopeptide (TPR) repeat protein
MINHLRKALVVVFLASFVGLASAEDEWATSYQFELQGNYSKAIQTLSPILKQEPDHEFARLRIAWLRYLNRDFNASARDYKRALEINGDSLEAQLGITLPLLAQARWREAEQAAQAVLAIAPWNYYAHVRMLVAAEGQAKWDSLADRARALSARYPTDATALVYLARAEARRGNTQEARRAYAAVLERVPDHIEAGTFLVSGSR